LELLTDEYEQLIVGKRRNKNLKYLQFAFVGICTFLMLTSCRESEAIQVEEVRVEMPKTADLLRSFLTNDTVICMDALYESLDFKLQWSVDTARRLELLHLFHQPYSIGLLPNSNITTSQFSDHWKKSKVDTVKGLPLLAEFTATHLLNYLLQQLETGHGDVPSSACPDSADIVKLKGIFASSSLKEGLKAHLSPDLGRCVTWIDEFYGAANFDYAPEPIPDYKKDSAASMQAVRAALTDYGLMKEMPDSVITGDTIIYALKQFQLENGLEPDGVIGKRTRAALEKTNRERYGQLLANLERTRDQSDWQKGDAHIEVNVPEYAVRFYIDGEMVRKHKVIVGKRKKHETPSFKASMSEIVVNPTWNVPYSISTKELLPKQKNDSCYLDAHEYIVYDRFKNVVDPVFVDWSELNINNFPYTVVQQPGRINALGTIKFLFPNKYSVYLHDTPSRRLFANTDRDYSHGCIRLDDPYPLALDILNYVDSKVDSATLYALLDTAEVYSIPIYPKIPVIINYGSVMQSDDGEHLIFYNDLYKRDEEWVGKVMDLDLR